MRVACIWLIVAVASAIGILGVGAPINLANPKLPGVAPADPTATPCTTGSPWNQLGRIRGNGICVPYHILIHGLDDRFGGDGMSPGPINSWQDACQDDVSTGPVYASPGSDSSSHSWFDSTYSRPSVGTGCRSLTYTNEEIMFDYKNELGDNTGGASGDGVCTTQFQARDGAYMTYIALVEGAEATSSPLVNDDVVHAKPGPAKSPVSHGDGDSGRITGGSFDCVQSPAPDAIVYKYMMNPAAPDMQGQTIAYFRGVYGDPSPSDYPSSGFTWNAATPASGITNPNGDGSTTCPYNPANTGAYSCYDIYYLDQAAPHYDRGQIGAAFTGSYELDPSAAPTAGVWDWTNSYPGLIGAQLGFVNTLKRPSPNGSSFLVWLNGFATGSGGTVANDTASPSPLPASVESCNSDELGGNALGSGQGTASDIVGGTIENAWTDNATNIPAPRLWAVNLNCVSDIQSEGSSIFAEVGGHSVGFDTPADGYDLSTAAHTGVTPAPAPTSIAVDSTLVNGAQLGNNAYALMIDPATNPEIVSVAASSSGSISAIFTLRHTPPYTVRTLSPYSYRITEYALDLLAYVPGKTVVQMKYFTSVFDLPVYAEAFLVPVLASSSSPIPQFSGNPVSTLAVTPAPSPTNSAVTIGVYTVRDIQVGQTLNLFDQTGGVEEVTVTAVDRSAMKVTVASIAHRHTGVPVILRGAQAFDGCQTVYATPTPDMSTSGGIGSYLISGTCGTDGLIAGTSRAGGVYCREFANMSYDAESAFEAAACVNMTNQSVPFYTLIATGVHGGCGGTNCLTQSYTHVCGAIDNKDDACLGESPPVNTTIQVNCASPPCMNLTVNVADPSHISANGSYLVDAGDPTGEEEVLVADVNVVQKTITATFNKSHNGGSLVQFRSPTATILLDGVNGGGGTFCKAGFPNFTFVLSSCPSVNTGSTGDSIPPMSGVILLQ